MNDINLKKLQDLKKEYNTYLKNLEKSELLIYKLQSLCKHIWIPIDNDKNDYKCKVCDAKF